MLLLCAPMDFAITISGWADACVKYHVCLLGVHIQGVAQNESGISRFALK